MMKKLLALLLALLLLATCATACGEKADPPVVNEEEDEPAPSINYEDYIKPVVDRKVSDCITEAELSDMMDVEVKLVIDTDSAATYQSDNGYYMVTLALESRTRDEFDAMVADTTLWTRHVGVGEVAYWGVGQTEMVAYQSGYAVSVSGYNVYYGCLETIMKRLVDSLKQEG